MKIILDSTAYRADFLLKGNAFQILLPALERIGASIILPEVVLEEVVNGYREELSKYQTSIQKLNRDARRLGLNEPGLEFSDEMVSTELARYKKQLVTTLKAEIPEIPNTPHPDFVKRALARRKPFNENGAGYRDALIWETVLRVLERSSTTDCFVTANTRDFCRGDALHSDLLQDVEQRGIPANRLMFFPSVDKLNAALVLPKLEHLKDVLNQVAADKWGTFRLKNWVLSDLGELMLKSNVAMHLSKLASEGSIVHGPTVKSVKGSFVDDVRGIPGGKILVSARAELIVEMAFGLMGEDHFGGFWEEIRTLPSFYGFGFTEQTVDVEAEFSLVIEPSSYEVVSAQIDEIEGETDSGRLILNSHPTRCG